MSRILSVLTWNTWVGQAPKKLEANLFDLVGDTQFPHVVSLQEVKRWKGHIPGYFTVRLPEKRVKHPDNLSTVLLVRNRLPIRRTGYLHVRGNGFDVPRGIHHPPRIFPWADFLLDNRYIFFMADHRTPARSYKENEHSWEQEHKQQAGWVNRRAKKHPHKPIFISGDKNERESDRGPFSLRQLAGETFSHLAMKGIDGTMFRNATLLTSRELNSKYGSDAHAPVVQTFEV